MPEETLRYKVQIDQQDLPSQLEQVKTKIDQAMGAASFQAQPQSPDALGLVDNVSGFVDRAQEGVYKFRQEVRQAGQIFQNVQNSAQLGFSRFMQDTRLQGLVSDIPEFENANIALMSQYAPRAAQAVEERGFLRRTLGATLGTGYDQNMRVSRGEYMRAMEDTRDVPGFLKNAAWSAFSFGATAVGGLGLGLGLQVVKKVWDWADSENQAREQLGKYIQMSSYGALVNMNKTQAMNVAGTVRGMAQSGDIQATVGDAGDIEEVFTQFSEMGGFQNIRTVSEFQRESKQLIKNFRTVQHVMRSTTEEALQTMSDLINGGIAGSPGEASAFIQQAGTLASSAQVSTSNMLEVANQGAQMVKGSGMNMQSAAVSSMQLVETIKQGMREGSFGQTLVAQGGGIANTALSLQQQAYDFSNTPSGRLAVANALTGGAGASGIGAMMSGAAAAGGDWSPRNILDMYSDMQNQRDRLGATGLLGSQANLFVNMMEGVGIDNITQDRLAAFAQLEGGMSWRNANQLAAFAFTDRDPAGNYMRTQLDRYQNWKDEQPGGFGWLGGQLKAGGSRIMHWLGRQTEAVSDWVSRPFDLMFDSGGSPTLSQMFSSRGWREDVRDYNLDLEDREIFTTSPYDIYDQVRKAYPGPQTKDIGPIDTRRHRWNPNPTWSRAYRDAYEELNDQAGRVPATRAFYEQGKQRKAWKLSETLKRLGVREDATWNEIDEVMRNSDDLSLNQQQIINEELKDYDGSRQTLQYWEHQLKDLEVQEYDIYDQVRKAYPGPQTKDIGPIDTRRHRWNPNPTWSRAYRDAYEELKTLGKDAEGEAGEWHNLASQLFDPDVRAKLFKENPSKYMELWGQVGDFLEDDTFFNDKQRKVVQGAYDYFAESFYDSEYFKKFNMYGNNIRKASLRAGMNKLDPIMGELSPKERENIMGQPSLVAALGTSDKEGKEFLNEVRSVSSQVKISERLDLKLSKEDIKEQLQEEGKEVYDLEGADLEEATLRTLISIENILRKGQTSPSRQEQQQGITTTSING